VATNTPKKKAVKEDPRKTPSPAEAKIPGRVPLSLRPKQEATQPQQRSEDTIVPRGDHPEKAVYVARDKKSGAEVSFDQWGRKLDSIGNVVHGDRQRAGDAGAKEIYRPPAPTPPAPEFKSSPSVGASLTRSPWDRSPMGPPPQPSPGYEIGAGITPGPRGTGVGASAPGGYNPFDNRGFPNTMPPSMADITGSGNRMGQPEGGSLGFEMPQWKPSWDIRPLEDFMSGNNPFSPVAPKVNIAGYGQLPASAAEIPMQTAGLEPMANIPGFGQLPQDSAQYAPPRPQQEWIDIPGFGRIPKFR
jgi:hypothetical protein